MFGIRIVTQMLTNIVHFSVECITKQILLTTKHVVCSYYGNSNNNTENACFFAANSLLHGKECQIYRCFWDYYSLDRRKKTTTLVCYKTLSILGLTVMLHAHDNQQLDNIHSKNLRKNRLIHFLSQVSSLSLNYNSIIIFFRFVLVNRTCDDKDRKSDERKMPQKSVKKILRFEKSFK